MKKLLLCVIPLWLLLVVVRLAFAQSSPLDFLSTASSESATLVFANRARLAALVASNITGTVYYLKLYDTATTPICGTDIPKWRIPLPINSSTVSVPVDGDGVQFSHGIGFCLNGGIADNDLSNATSGISLNFAVSALPQ
jgi:hypothetical protein